MTQSQMNLSDFDDSNQTKSQIYNNYLIESPRFNNQIQIQRVNDVDDGYDSSNQLSFYQSDSHSGSVFLKGECGNLLEILFGEKSVRHFMLNPIKKFQLSDSN